MASVPSTGRIARTMGLSAFARKMQAVGVISRAENTVSM